MACSTITIAPVVIRKTYSRSRIATDENLEVLKTGCFKYFEMGGDCIDGPVSLLSAYVFVVPLHLLTRLVTDRVASSNSGLDQIRLFSSTTSSESLSTLSTSSSPYHASLDLVILRHVPRRLAFPQSQIIPLSPFKASKCSGRRALSSYQSCGRRDRCNQPDLATILFFTLLFET